MGKQVVFRIYLFDNFKHAAEIPLQQLSPLPTNIAKGSLLVDRTGYKKPMYLAFMLQAASGVLYFVADGYSGLYYASVCAGLGHGIVEAVINPVCAAVYPKEKTTRLTILHAAWPAGLAGGTLLFMPPDQHGSGHGPAVDVFAAVRHLVMCAFAFCVEVLLLVWLCDVT